MKILIAVGLVVLAVASRFLPHPPNFSPVLAVALFAGHVFTDRKLAYGVALGAVLISDAVLGFYEGMVFVYLSYAAIVALGGFTKSRRPMNLVFGAALSSVIFFFFSNLGVWAFSNMYEKTWAGLSSCFVMALPFFHNTLASTLLSTFVLFTAYALVVRRTLDSKYAVEKSDTGV